uniref:Uncharacterized protein n=1 Tax=Panagrolaimus sp. PS1159 TaxID=55785 RepID=A0AC35FQR2_9BILA
MLRRKTVVPRGCNVQPDISKHHESPHIEWNQNHYSPIDYQQESPYLHQPHQSQPQQQQYQIKEDEYPSKRYLMKNHQRYQPQHHHLQHQTSTNTSHQLHSAKERRSRSQPQQFRFDTNINSNINYSNIPTSTTFIEAQRLSMDSETSGSNDSGIRSSTHSTTSSIGASTISNAQVNDDMLIVEAIWDHVAMLADELPFAQGDVITVLDATSTSGLWYGMCRDRTGWFPASYVKIKSEESIKPSSQQTSPLKDDEFPSAVRYQRRRVVEELMETERDYVKLLKDLVYGFLEQCKKRKEMFNNDRITRIFGNISSILSLHINLLKELEASFDKESPENSLIANAFLRNSRSFNIYTEYCNNRPVSCTELATIERQPKYRHFFEACRLLRGMSKLTLEGFLLTPVQRICRYPLQLFELLKSTPTNHLDRIPLEQAHRTMKAVAIHINDSKRRIDSIQKIILWQKNVHGFRGPDIIENNHRTLISGELHCRAIMKRSIQWSKLVHVYLFDQSIVICKKDVLKKNSLVFKERMSLQTVNVIDINDGKEPITGAQLKNSFKLTGPVREYIFTCPDPATKGLWIETLRNRPRPMPPTNAEKRLAIVMLP